MNTLIEHLKEVCRRNGVKIDYANIVSFLESMDDESIIEILNSQDTVEATLKYGLIDINTDTDDQDSFGDNSKFQTKASTIIFDEANPFGEF
jgi:hypothetical protein